MDERDFGMRLRQLRHERSEKLEDVAKATGLSIAMLSRVERGERLPSPDSVEVLARHFGLPADELMSDAIAHRMLNRYGPASSRHAAEKMRGEGLAAEGLLRHDVADSRRFDEDGVVASEPQPAAHAPRAAAPASLPMRTAGMAFSARPIEELFGEDVAREALANAERTADAAIDAAIAAARRATASGDPQLEAEGRRVLRELHRKLDQE